MTKDEALQLALEALEEIGLKWSNVLKAIDAIKEALETKDEPVGWIDSKGYMICVKTDESCRPLYTTPQRTWVGLDPDEFKFIASKYLLNREVGLEYFQEEIEAKLKEKNNAI